MASIILNQYRERSTYKDEIGKLYHFPNKYLNRFKDLPSAFLYYEPREGGQQIYFGCGIVQSVVADTEDVAHTYAELSAYRRFTPPVDFYAGPGGATWESAKVMRNSVRDIEQSTFEEICLKGGVTPPSPIKVPSSQTDFISALQSALASLPPPGSRTAPVLRRVQRMIESYERPSRITNAVKHQRGDTCQMCGQQGFVKRDGGRYCEVHHLFHLAKDPPAECLEPRFLVVVCATCHRRLHYAQVGEPISTSTGWKLLVDEQEIVFQTLT
jgi:hypothetical protein